MVCDVPQVKGLEDPPEDRDQLFISGGGKLKEERSALHHYKVF